ncbi:MAG: hypothetical protein ACLQVF_36700 [Isosphaeraceae bacterium]
MSRRTGRAMIDADHFKQQLVRMAGLARSTSKRRSVSESAGTAVLGALSFSVGIFVLVIATSPLFGIRTFDDWHRNEWSHGADHRFPSEVVAMAAVVGEALGLAGLALGWLRNRTLSLVSLAGLLTCLIYMCMCVIIYVSWSL